AEGQFSGGGEATVHRPDAARRRRGHGARVKAPPRLPRRGQARAAEAARAPHLGRGCRGVGRADRREARVVIAPLELLRQGGAWLGAARDWIKWHARNGSQVTWGSDDVLEGGPWTVARAEDLAAHVAA